MELNLNNLSKIIPKLGIAKLKDLIKAIRACKTAADERAVIQKESANIRTSFKEENADIRYDNVAKLLYIHMLGYPAHFGQIECLKLAASPRFQDKRLAYLGIMLLLDENQETLTLVTNCLKNDMNSSNNHIIGLALCTFGNIASKEMSRDLAGEVERLLGSTTPYIRKKASLCALRIIRKVPDLAENFSERAIALLNERHHGVLLTGVTLLLEMCVSHPDILQTARMSVTTLVRHLKALSTGGSSPEHDVNGITDPFLQVQILKLLRVLGHGDAQASEAMNDVLAQVATNTESSKNVGNSILYEAVLTIMHVESSSSLRVLGINILGRFLANKDNNIRYVALTTLTKTAQTAAATDSSALQRHRTTILECLHDPDISIRRRALDLSFYLNNASNIRILTRELLSFLEAAESDIKASVASRICDYAGRYRPNKRWEIDTVTRVLRVAGDHVDQQVINQYIKLVSTGDANVHQYVSRKLYCILKTDEKLHAQEGLVQAAFWIMGEYGNILVNSTPGLEAFQIDEEADEDAPAIPAEQQVFELFQTILKGPFATSFVKEYGINGLAKLADRFRDPTASEIKAFVAKYRTNMDIEIQQRAVEYSQIFGLESSIRKSVLAPLPVLESAIAEEELKGKGVVTDSPKPSSPAKNDVFNILMEGNAPPAKKDDILDLLGGMGLGSKPAEVSPTPPVATEALIVYDKALKITFTPKKESATITHLLATFSGQGISNISFQVAAPKSMKLVMSPPTGTSTLTGNVTQAIKVENPSQNPIRLRIKISFNSNNQLVEEIVDFAGFDASLWS